MANIQPQGLTPADYLVWEAQQPIKYEYLEGRVYAMTGGTLPHNDIALNLYSLLRSHVRGRGCRVNVADAKVRVSANGPYFYPDIVVSCDDRDRRAIEAVHYPKLIIEVLSPSTAGFDRGDKFKFYRQIPTLQEYGLIDGDKVGVDCYRKTSGGKWELTTYPDDLGHPENPIVELVSLDFSCPLALVYEEVTLAQPRSGNDYRS
ncbi:Uma2 family endonuclease [Prochlorothrix hollandica]|uniref:Uma2 family endonuclease n=1 Tax=Prochlorothrix hollandica TaxID=1223 RepID=UPI003DA70B80